MPEKKRVVIVDCQLGNLFSVENALKYLGAECTISSNAAEIANARALVLPGVGAFGAAMKNLSQLDLVHPLKDFINSGRPFMGVCLGFQLLFSESHEFGRHKGLNVISGDVARFCFENRRARVPQIGWNRIYKPNGRGWEKTPLAQVRDAAYMYFVHSYYVRPSSKDHVLSYTTYEDLEYCSSMKSGTIFATQFHPEKSGPEGLSVYREFLKGISTGYP